MTKVNNLDRFWLSTMGVCLTSRHSAELMEQKVIGRYICAVRADREPPHTAHPDRNDQTSMGPRSDANVRGDEQLDLHKQIH
ncbi:MAG: hypothetical protein ABIY71_03450, partial [Flavobacteriales bacterium]